MAGRLRKGAWTLFGRVVGVVAFAVCRAIDAMSPPKKPRVTGSPWLDQQLERDREKRREREHDLFKRSVGP